MFYSTDQIEKARKVDLISYLHSNGYKLLKSGSNEYRLEVHDSLVISNNKWNWFSQNVGGNTIDFLVKYEGKDFMEAVGILLGRFNNSKNNVHIKTYVANKNKADNELKLPEKNNNYRRMFAYLIKTRCLDKDIVTALVKEGLIYESKDTHNVVFIGKDNEENVRHVSMKGTLSDKPYIHECIGSDKRYCFKVKGRSDTVYIFEAAIDLISHATIEKIKGGDYKKDHRITGCGISALPLFQYLEDNPEIKRVMICMDNDAPGREAAARMRQMLFEKGAYEISENYPPKGKDWNEFLKSNLTG